MASDELTPTEAQLLEEIDALLADPSLWTDPDPSLEDRVVAAISSEAEASATSTYRVYAQPTRARRWLSMAGAAGLGAAAAALITVMVTRDDPTPADASAAMTGTDLAPGVSGSADLTVVSSGVKIHLEVPGLPRRDGDDFYQVWLKSCDGTKLVPAGSFHELDDAVAWAGVALDDFPLISITKEAVAPPKDAAQGSSGEVVAAGAVHECEE